MADTSKDGMLNLVEIQKFLKKIEVNFSNDELKKLFKVNIIFNIYTFYYTFFILHLLKF